MEGLDGSGKTTVAQYLADTYGALVVHEPGGTPVGEAISDLLMQYRSNDLAPMTNLLLFSASRAELVETVIRPALRRGEFVVADRYVGSSLAYQGYGNGLSPSAVRVICNYSTRNVQPDKTILLDICATTSLARSNKANVRDDETVEYYQRVQYGYEQLAATYNWHRVWAEDAIEHVIDRVDAALTRW